MMSFGPNSLGRRRLRKGGLDESDSIGPHCAVPSRPDVDSWLVELPG